METYSVIVDGNKHHINPIRIKSGTVSIERCKKIVDAIESQYNISIDKIEIDMSEYGECKESYTGYEFREIKKEKTAFYYKKSNCLRIWQDGNPLYENNNGVICKDADVLADNLL